MVDTPSTRSFCLSCLKQSNAVVLFPELYFACNLNPYETPSLRLGHRRSIIPYSNPHARSNRDGVAT